LESKLAKKYLYFENKNDGFEMGKIRKKPTKKYKKNKKIV